MLCPHPMGLKRRATVPTLPPPRRVHPPAQRVRSPANSRQSLNVGFSGLSLENGPAQTHPSLPLTWPCHAVRKTTVFPTYRSARSEASKPPLFLPENVPG